MTEPTRVVLVSGHVFGHTAFEGIFASNAYQAGNIDVRLVIGLDERFATSTVGYRPMDELAAGHGIPHMSTTDGSLASLAERIRDCRPDYLIVIGWSRLVAPAVLRIPGSCVGMHPTRLPLGRGQAPIPWTIIKGLRSTALSVFLLEADADTGPIVAQYEMAIDPRETAESLFDRMNHQHFQAGLDLAPALADRAVCGTPQDHAVATRWPKRRPADGEITGEMAHAEIDALVRALLGPYPRAFVSIGGQRHAVVATEPANGRVDDGRRVRFRCRDGIIALLLDR